MLRSQNKFCRTSLHTFVWKLNTAVLPQQSINDGDALSVVVAVLLLKIHDIGMSCGSNRSFSYFVIHKCTGNFFDFFQSVPILL